MAQDLGFDEILVIHEAVGALPAPGAAVAERAAPAAEREGEETRVLLRFGDRVEIRASAPGVRARGIAAPPEVSEAVLQELTETERFGVEAMRLRSQPGYKPTRPRDGELWDMPGCAGAPEPASREAGAAGAIGTSDYLMGSVALGVVIVNGPTAATRFTAAEQTKVVAEVQAGAALLAELQPLGRRQLLRSTCASVNITTPAQRRRPRTTRARFRNPAMAALGFQANWNGVSDYINVAPHEPAHQLDLLRVLRQGIPARPFRVRDRSAGRASSWTTPTTAGARTTSIASSRTRPATSSSAPDEYASSGCNCGGAGGGSASPMQLRELRRRGGRPAA